MAKPLEEPLDASQGQIQPMGEKSGSSWGQIPPPLGEKVQPLEGSLGESKGPMEHSPSLEHWTSPLSRKNVAILLGLQGQKLADKINQIGQINI